MKRSLDKPACASLYRLKCVVICLGLAGATTSNSAQANPNHTVVATVALGNGSVPMGVVVSPDSTYAYVACEGSSNIAALNLATNSVGFTIPMHQPPYRLAITSDGSTLFALTYIRNDQRHSALYKVDIATRKILGSKEFDSFGAISITISPDGSYIYLSNSLNTAKGLRGKLQIFTTNNLTLEKTIGSIGETPYQLAFTPDGKHAYVAVVPTVATGSVSYIDTVTQTLAGVILSKAGGPIFFFPSGAAVTPDGNTLYITQDDAFDNSGGETKGVVVIDATTNAITSWLSIAPPGANTEDFTSNVGYSALTPDGKYLYVPIFQIIQYNPDGSINKFINGKTVGVVDTTKGTVIQWIKVGQLPEQIAIAPDSSLACVTNDLDGTVSVIDISGS